MIYVIYLSHMSVNILVIEDEADIRELVSLGLKNIDYEIDCVESADRAHEFYQKKHYHLFIIDWMLPGNLNGLDLCLKLRQNPQYKETPIIMLTALTQPDNIVQGLDAGADDYITKPFDLSVFKARVRAHLRSFNLMKNGDSEINHFVFGSLKIDLPKCKVWVEDEEIQLTSTEFKILVMMSAKPGHVFTREQLITHVQGENIYVTGRTVDTHIAGLRKKLGAGAPLIETIRGIGYRFTDESLT